MSEIHEVEKRFCLKCQSVTSHTKVAVDALSADSKLFMSTGCEILECMQCKNQPSKRRCFSRPAGW